MMLIDKVTNKLIEEEKEGKLGKREIGEGERGREEIRGSRIES